MPTSDATANYLLQANGNGQSPTWVDPNSLSVNNATNAAYAGSLGTASTNYSYSSLKSALDNKQPLDADLTAIAGLTGTSGFLKKTATNTWELDTNTYATTTALSNHTSATNNPHGVTKDQVQLGDVVNAGQTDDYTSTETGDSSLYFTKAGARNLYTELNGLISNVTAVAEGKTKAYVISFLVGTNNAGFQTQSEFEVDLNSGEKIHTLDGNDINITSLKTGDIIYVIQPTVPDRWVNVNTTANKVYFHVLETTKVDLTSYALKSETVSNVAYDSTNKKLTKTINGTTSDIVTIATIKTALSLAKGDVGLGNVENTALSTWAGTLNLTTCSQGTFGAAAIKGVSTSITDNDTNLVTGEAVYEHVKTAVGNEHKSYIMNIEDQAATLITKLETQADFEINIDFTESTDSSIVFNLATGGTLNMAKLHSGDIIYLIEPNFPDRWIEIGASSIYFHILETYTPKITASQNQPSIRRDGDVWLDISGGTIS